MANSGFTFSAERRGKPGHVRMTGYILSGAVLVFTAIYVSMANDHWAVLYWPPLPWEGRPPAPMIEMKIWGLSLASFGAGALLLGWLGIRYGKRQRRLLRQAERKMAALQSELTSLNRVVVAAKSQPKDNQGIEPERES